MKLTVKKIEQLKKQPGRYFDGHGLYLQVLSKTNQSWLLRYERNKKERWMGLGPLHTFGLSEARERARKARQQLFDGIDPLEQRRQEKTARALEAAKSKTFHQCADDYFLTNRDSWKSLKWAKQFSLELNRYAYPIIGALPVSAVDTGLVLKVLEQRVEAARGLPAGTFWLTRNKLASRVRGRIEAILDFATVRGYRTGDNPARWTHLKHALGKKAANGNRHHAALPYKDLPEFLVELRQLEGVAARALEFTILTAARTGEALGATWPEIDLNAKTWTIPAERMKATKEHRVPLSDRAVELLSALPREQGNSFVFIGAGKGSGLSKDAMPAVLQRLGREGITVHGFRSTFRDWAAEQTSYPNHVVEMALAHTIGNAVEAAYRRGDLFKKRIALMEAWSRYCSSPAATGANVVVLRGAGQ
jgi:integrase